jgi:ABC-type bacteriocin/lantibiotic exporter with double-glycine peptidase domain
MKGSVRLRFAILAAMLCVCAASSQASGVWIDVPFVKQKPEGCGAASIAMVMQYWSAQDGEDPGQRADAAYVLRVLHSRAGHGIYASSMSQYLEDQGFRTFAFNGDWNLLHEHLLKGRPLIVALKPVGAGNALHYVVVAGIDLDQQIIMVNDPAERKLIKLDRVAFEKQWGGAKRWTLLALPQPSGH